MKPTLRPPSPPMPRGWTYLQQKDFFRQTPDLPPMVSLDVLNTIAQGVESTVHTYGGKVERGRIFILGEKLSVSLMFNIGGQLLFWHANTTALGHASGRLCARLLRFVQGLHEEAR